MSEIKNVLSGASKTGITLVITMLLSLIFKMVLPRALGAERLGVYYLCESLAASFMVVLPLGMGIHISKILPEDHSKVKGLFKSILVFEIIFAAIILTIEFILLYFMNYSKETIVLTAILSVASAFAIIYQDTIKRTFNALGRYSEVSIVDVLSKIIFVSIATTLLLLSFGLMPIALTTVLVQMISIFLILLIAYISGYFDGEMELKRISKIALVTLPFFLSNVLSEISTGIDMIILSKLGNNTEIGYYGAAVKYKGIFLLLSPILYQTVLPALSRLKTQDTLTRNEFIEKIANIIIASSYLLGTALIVFASEGSMLLYGKDFSQSVLCIQLLAPSVLFTYLNILLMMNANLNSNGLIAITITIVQLLANSIFSILFILWGQKLYSVGGAAAGSSLATTLAEILVFFSLLFFARKYYSGINIIARISKTFFVFCLCGYLISLGSGVSLPIKIALYVVCVPLSAFLLGIFKSVFSPIQKPMSM